MTKKKIKQPTMDEKFSEHIGMYLHIPIQGLIGVCGMICFLLLCYFNAQVILTLWGQYMIESYVPGSWGVLYTAMVEFTLMVGVLFSFDAITRKGGYSTIRTKLVTEIILVPVISAVCVGLLGLIVSIGLNLVTIHTNIFESVFIGASSGFIVGCVISFIGWYSEHGNLEY